MARILLIYPQPDTIKQSRFGFSLTLLYTSSILKNAGHTTILRDFSVEDYEDASILNEMEKADLAVVEYDAFPLKRSLNISNAGYIMELIRAHFPGKKIIAIGYDFALFPRNHEQADFTFTIEPENGITRVVSALLENKSISTSEIGVVNYLDDLPFPDRNLLSDFAQHGGSVKHKPNLEKSTLVQTSRGCSNSCVFCQRKGWLNKYREHSIEYVLREFSWLKEEEYVNVWICDDNFTLNLNRAKNILKRLFYAKLAEYMKISARSHLARRNRTTYPARKEALRLYPGFFLANDRPDITRYLTVNELSRFVIILVIYNIVGDMDLQVEQLDCLFLQGTLQPQIVYSIGVEWGT